ncbi:MAG: ferredoxin, partial [Pseudomonadales bacterium]|nr:ferredoxin [Pseudomonadales bacterium]
EVHDSWFANFDWEAFSDNELHLVPAIVAVETTDHAAGDQMNAVSRVLNSGKPLQIAMTVSAHGNPEKTGDDPLRGFRMELAYFGIGHREAVVNQVSTARAGSLIDGFSSAFESTRPSLHLIHTGYTSPQPLHPWIMASAALESRAHPYIRFNPAFVDGGQIDFADNPSGSEDWASNEITWRESDDVTVTRHLEFTFADYCLLKPGLRSHFRLVPEDIESEDLVGVGEYLRADRADQDRLIPFVWAVDAEGAVRKVIVSRVLMFACRDRSGFWRDLQSMAGIHNFYVDQAVARARDDERITAAAELDERKQADEEELENVRASAAEDIMGRLTDVLLGLDLSDAALRGSSPAAAPQPAAQPEPAEEPTAGAEDATAEPEVEEEPEEEISFDEPWIDSMLCTSCDDCMAINKTLFVYNEDKQAVISDPAKGTYEQLVRAAELCPAKCIHPGKPQNSSEPNLEELMKRAEPFN